MRSIRNLLWLLLFSFVAPLQAAHAVTGLAWQWQEGVQHRYLLQVQVRLSELMWFKATLNREVRVVEFRANVITNCRCNGALGKKAWRVNCKIEDIALQAAPVVQEAGLLQAVLDEMATNYRGATAQLQFMTDGRLRNIDLEGVDKRNRRIAEIHETMRLILVRALAPLDLQLPKKGDDGERGFWKQSNVLAMAFPSNQGTMGSSSVEHRIVKQEGDILTLNTEGRGTLGTGETIIVANQERPKNLYDMSISGSAEFDRGRGVLLRRDYMVQGMPTASSLMAEGAQGIPYVQAAHVELIAPGQPLPELGATKELAGALHPYATAPLRQRKR